MGGDESRDQAIRLLNDIQDISFGKVALIILATWISISALRRLLPYLAAHGPADARLYILGAVPIARLTLTAIAIVWILPIIFNITFQNFLVIAGAASVAIGFAFKDYVSSLIAGIVAIFEKPYRPGDWVTIDGDYGEVKRVGLRALTLNTADDNVITVPHSVIWSANVSNGNDGARTLQCVAEFFIQTAHDASAVRSTLQDVALTSAYLDYHHPVTVVLQEAPWGTHYKIRAYPFDMRDQFLFISDLTLRGRMAIQSAGYETVRLPLIREGLPEE
ncbi:mechanosensitive ion channel family protein [Paracoccus sp. SM22M-07]|uniref:mechanosensitive ion channel family protein n=1 Tax=Paracoccus sp. SM22M-07 TaxID=1520813 RepID=UPI0009152488|nr:mechanosensitive ion channel domain-containing protein [Paracoccus sp. SM22M-07]OJH43102.1 mechanosensitive ion channel protein MscS [Paracoccus sp. SM22M-07]